MLLKYSKFQQRTKLSSTGKPRSTGNIKGVNGKGKGHKKGIKSIANKRIKIATKRDEVPPITVDPCDNSNDSGLGFDHHLEFAVPRTTQTSFIEPEYCWTEEAKRQRLDVKLECDNASDNFSFPQTRVVQQTPAVSVCHRVVKNVPVAKGKRNNNQLFLSQSVGVSRDGKVQLQILSQPEMQHRARYQTEGSRGAVKDRTGNSFPIVQLTGYNKPATLEVYIGTDQGRVAPHMFYQACRVSGKNSTPCVEKKLNGTVLIEIELDPSKDMIATCDCVGILKERNVDVEHRFPEESSSRSKKKSTRCRMVFKTVITNDDNIEETLQVTSQPIICTQPPGVPEICKKSLSSCSAAGGLELFILGKNFLKDTKVVFSDGEFGTEPYWEAVVQPDKEFLQQSHLVCVIPPYRQDIKEPVAVRLNVISSERSSETHTFLYTPIGTSPMQALSQEPNVINRAVAPNIASEPPFPAQNLLLGMSMMMPTSIAMGSPGFIAEETKCNSKEEKIPPVLLMPPPTGLPARRGSQPMILDPSLELKREAESPTPQQIPVTSDLATSQTPSLATLRRFVSTPNAPLPALSVETYFSRIENKHINTETTTSHISQKTSPLSIIQSRKNTALSSVYTTQGLLQNDMASDILRAQTLQDQITASLIANREQETAKLDALVNSTVENHLSPQPMETQVISKPEILLNSDVPMPMQTSPLNLNTNETLSQSPVSMSHIVENKIISPPLICALPQTSVPITSGILTNPLVNEAGDLILRTVTDTIDMNVTPIPSTNFEMGTSTPVTQVTNSTELIMKAVVNDLTHTPPFTTSSDLNMPTTIKDVLSSQNQLQESIILTSDFTNNNIISTTQGNNFIGTLGESNQNLSSPHFRTDILSGPFVENRASGEEKNQENQFRPDIFPPTTVDNNLNILKTNPSPPRDLSPRFEQQIIFNPTEIPTLNESPKVPNSSFQTTKIEVNPGFENTSQGAILNEQALNITSTKMETIESCPPTFRPDIINTFTTEAASIGISRKTIDTTNGQVETRTPDIPKVNNGGPVKKCEEGIPLPQELTQMSEHDLLSYINPSCFDQV